MISDAGRCSGDISRKTNFIRMAAMLAGLCFMSACGYHFAGSAGNTLAAGQSLWVSFIEIEIDSPSAQTVLRRALLEEGHALRGLYPSADAASADLRVTGKLRSYTARAMSYSALDQARLYRLTLEVDLELFRKGDTAPFWKGTLQGFQDYPANTDLAQLRSSEAAALVSVSHILAQKFLMSVEQVY